ncbi:antitoxin Xre/MbcA/ParS toxin-binding domain-containing protein [Falsihalocynthiibacter sp. S25ZX9]|uniref:antitoxin Xre/MbcA/ParS toxin-binding domain-containing protein n=1 Tax=Falsihalocynthiibacter sp. S25ZX9 TaxID=3240870 RepID=UPI00350F1184
MNTIQRLASVPSREAILTKATTRAAARLGLSGRFLADVLGVSEAQVSRFKNGEATLAQNTKSFELAALLVRVFRSLDAIVGGDDRVACTWLKSENTALGAQPLERMTSIQGLMDVVTYLDTRRAPI